MKLFGLFALVAAAPLYAGEIVPSQVPAAAKWVCHADVDAVRDSETGKAIFSRIEQEHGAQLLAVQRMFSIQPLTDIHGITLFGDNTPETAVAVIDARFNRSHMEDIVKGADGYIATDYAGYTVHSWVDHGSRQQAAFVTDNLVVFSKQEDALKAELDLLKANAPGVADPLLKTDGSRPLLTARAKLGDIKLPEDAARLVKMARSLRLTAGEAAGRFTLKLSADTKDAEDARKLQKMVDGVLAFAEVNNPKLQGLDLDSAVTLETDPAGLAVTAGLPVTQLLSLLGQVVDGQKH